MKTTEEMIAVMQAYADGKEIEFQHYTDHSWYPCPTPTWNWRACDYRIKQEPPQKKIVPYESAEEFLQAQKEHGPYLQRMKNAIFRIPFSVGDKGIEYDIDGNEMESFYELYNSAFWQDGTSCGKEA